MDEDRRGSGQPCGGGEVAGLDDVDDSCTATVTSSVPGAGGIRSHRRNRPLSLAVQPLNYHRLDPDHKTAAEIAVRHHHSNMTSQESIGSCSLDVDRSASDRSGWLYRHYCERESRPHLCRTTRDTPRCPDLTAALKIRRAFASPRYFNSKKKLETIESGSPR